LENKTKTLTISKHLHRNIRSIAYQNFDRDINFPSGCEYSVVLASYYGGKGYTCHKTADAAMEKSQKESEYYHQIIDIDGNILDINGSDLVVVGSLFES